MSSDAGFRPGVMLDDSSFHMLMPEARNN